jgi:hypothetical protein
VNSRQSILTPAVGLVLLTVFLGTIAVSNDSFWMDECLPAERVKQPTLAEAWRMQTGPEVQLPLYMLYLWGFAQVFGTGEWTLRAAGVPWFVFGLAAFVAGFRSVVRSRVWIVFVAGFGAFAWYYLNEAKVYSTQLGCGLAIAGAGAAVLQSVTTEPSRFWWRIFLVSFWLFCGTSVLAMFWGFFFLVGFVLLIPHKKFGTLLRLSPVGLALCVVGLAALAIYYGWTMTFAARPTAIGTTNAQTVVYVFYELLGFSGWGPGRNELRAQGLSALQPFVVPLALYGASTAFVFATGLKEAWARYSRTRLALCAIALGLPLALLCAYGMATNFRVLGRHATPLLPFLLIILAIGASRLWSLRWGRALVAFFAIAWVGSSINVRFAARHKKDNYRAAAALAKASAAAGQRVWWNAESSSADYYKVPTNSVPILVNVVEESIRGLPPPDLIIVSKPDAFDSWGTVQKYIREHGYRSNASYSAFTVWKKPD